MGRGRATRLCGRAPLGLHGGPHVLGALVVHLPCHVVRRQPVFAAEALQRLAGRSICPKGHLTGATSNACMSGVHLLCKMPLRLLTVPRDMTRFQVGRVREESVQSHEAAKKSS